MRSTRPTIWPMRPKPAMMTGASDGSMVSNSGAGARIKRGIRNRSDSANRIGVASIDAAEINVANAASSGDRAPTATAAPSSTKLNSLACGKARLKRIAFGRSRRISRDKSKGDHGFDDQQHAGGDGQIDGTRDRRVQIGRHSDGDEEEAEQACSRMARCRPAIRADIPSPTASLPPETLLRTATSPAAWASSAVPVTINSAAVVNSSGELAPPMARNNGPMRKPAAGENGDDRERRLWRLRARANRQ